jgi:ankyrin repeat protein
LSSNAKISGRRSKSRNNTLQIPGNDKERFTYITNEIKSHLLKKMKNPFDILKFYIEDNNEFKFKEVFNKKFNMDIESRDKRGNTLLSLAVQVDMYNVSEFLLDQKADVNTQNEDLNTPLHYALMKKNFKLANLLLQRKADESIRNKSNLTPWECLQVIYSN